MICMLRASGPDFDVDSFLRDHPSVRADAVWHGGERNALGRVLPESGFSLFLGEVTAPQDAFKALRAQQDLVAEIRAFDASGVGAELDFGIAVNASTPMAQITLRLDEVRYCAENGLSVTVTLYAASDD